jgi:hypothetical protein
LVLPLMDIASDVSRMSANVVGPIAVGNYAHRKEEVKRKKMNKSTKVTQKTGLVMVNKFVHGHSPPDKRVQLKKKVVSAASLFYQQPCPSSVPHQVSPVADSMLICLGIFMGSMVILLNSRTVQPLFFLGNLMEYGLYLKFLQGWPMEIN